MQKAISETREDQDITLQFYRVTVLLEPITESSWYEMKREQQNLPAFSDANKLACSFCLDELSPSITYAKCLDCEQCEVLICIECLRMGMESHPHTRSHRYTFSQEDLQLLNALLHSHLNQWPELSKDWGRKKTLADALEHLDKCFIRGPIGQYILKNYSRGYVKDWSENDEQNPDSDYLATCSDITLPSTSTSTNVMKNDFECDGNTRNGKMDISSRKLEEKLNPIASSSNLINSSPLSTKRNYFDEEEESDEELPEIVEKRNSSQESITDNNEIASNGVFERKSRKEQLLAAAKNVAAEAIRGKSRKTSLELSEAAINLDGNSNGEASSVNNTPNKKNQQIKEKKEFLSPEQITLLYASSKYNPYFYNHPPHPMDAHTVAKFDEEDLQLLTYLPYRDEFETEYKNEAEQLITQLVFLAENEQTTESDRFLNEVNFARFNRYNRLMRIRAAKRAIILEHRMLAEYLNIVKTNISEKGKYLVFPDRYFSTKSKEDAYRPIFAQLRQVADRETINHLAKDVAAMETLKDQIEELKMLQSKGITRVKGRLKVDLASMIWSRKRRTRKTENAEMRKASLRWKRIKRWTKRTHLQQQLDEPDDDDDQ
uniref:Uncharacterized protein n=1 Tax=Meloidogyne enterolobii TaxID=390850 RepID=A0A6V7U211_MELEN|nr:unnamed protein product [Meloidogyne enterolobii]